MNLRTPAVQTLAYSAALGIGSGMMLPTFSVAVQNVFPRQQFGLVTSTIQFFRNMGATVGAAIFGSIMLRSMNSGFAGVDLSNVSPHIASLLRNPRVLVNPEALRQIKAQIPPEGLSLFIQLLEKTRDYFWILSLGVVQ